MAVSFKVPKSPKRDIFVIDNFMGVDLTNSGANVDEVRSPNAPNMVRFVPGKVRKRMGYKKEIIFGTDMNVNYAIGTSNDEQSYVITDEMVGKWNEIYQFVEPIKSRDGQEFDVYVEFDYMNTEEHDFWVKADIQVPHSSEWQHFSYVEHMESNKGWFVLSLWSWYPQTIYIKNFSIMREKNADYEWSPAPEYLIHRDNDEPVYGCHILRTGSRAGNAVVNVNRVLETSSSSTTYTLTDSTVYTPIGTLAESMLNDATREAPLIVQFDYTLSGDDVQLYVGNRTGTSYVLSETEEEKHFSLKSGGTQNKTEISLRTRGDNSVVTIKNLSACYEVNSDYEWSPAPEDEGKTFDLGNVYYHSSKNYAASDSFSNVIASSTGNPKIWFTAVDQGNPDLADIKGNFRCAFDLETSCSSSLSEVWLTLLDQNNYTIKQIKYDHTVNQHYEFYLPGYNDSSNLKTIAIDYISPTTGSQIVTEVKNLEVNSVYPREIFDVAPQNYIYHVGSDFYLRAGNGSSFTKIYGNANKHISQSWQLDQTLFIIDGKDIYSYNLDEPYANPVSDSAYIPTVTIAKSPSGGGTPYEPLNMLQPGFIEQFAVPSDQASVQDFQLSFNGLDPTETKAWVMDGNGNWILKKEGTDYSVNRGTGVIHFNTAPGRSLTSEDNVKIQAYRTVRGYRDRIAKCTVGTFFGVGGAADRLFLSGNPDYPNWDFYSEQHDATYFADTWYSVLGSAASRIIGYAVVNNYLAAFKDEFDSAQSVFIREGDLVKNTQTNISEPAFKLINTLQGNGVIAPYAFGYLQTEPVFLTKAGIYAITAQDITGEKYSQNRSFYLNGKLTEEENLEDAIAVVYNDQYILAINDQLYVLDGLQPVRTDRAEPYATRQYAAFYCTGIPAFNIWTDEKKLCFGTYNGRVCEFYTNVEDLSSYNDDGKAISAWWETPDLDGKLFYKNKTFRYFAVRLMQAMRTSAKLWSQKLSTWTPVKEDSASGVVFDFNDIDFTNFSFSTDTSEKVIHAKLRVKKVDKARFKVENSKKNEPFGLFDLALEYVESGNYKR